MKKKIITTISLLLLFAALGIFGRERRQISADDYITYTADPATQQVKMFWKDSSQNKFRNFGTLKNWLSRQQQQLLFAMNGGMYKEDRSPLGLYIENGKTLSRLNKASAEGNFYLKPNGVFFISKNRTASIVSTEKFVAGKSILYATQSGPMLLVDGKIHAAFTKGSANVNIRNGVGILPGNKIVFVLSKNPVNLYDFAQFFKSMGCKDALYLDGFVSRTYLPEKKWIQTDGDFGVIIAVTK
jgi:uncharacterized protein YigE (DUF2233 family)